MKIGIIGAMEEEVSILLNEMEECVEHKYVGTIFNEGLINGVDVVITQCGVGKVNASIAASVLISIFECDFIINTGIAGGYGLNTRDVVLGSKISYYDADVTIFGYPFGCIPGMPKDFLPSIEGELFVKSILRKLNIEYKSVPIYSGDSFITSLEQLKKVDYPSSFATEMEGAAIAQTCTKAGIGFVILRYISDCIGSESQIDNYNEFEEEMAHQSAKICLQIINNVEFI